MNTNTEYLFGIGQGWLPRSAARAAEKRGAVLVNHTDPQCSCGHGCPLYACKASRRHWFACDNRGEPQNSQVERAVLSAVERGAQ
jgi:hypothetical protein